MPIFTEDEIKFLKDNYKIIGKNACSEQLGRSIYSIGNEVRRLNLVKKVKEYSDEERKFIKENYPKFGSPKCADFCNRSQSTVAAFARGMGLKFEKEIKYYINDISQFENIKDPSVAYFLGLLWADGSVSPKQEGYEITVTLVEDDMLAVEPVFDSIGVFQKVIKKNTNPNWKKALTFRLSCRKLHTFLFENNYHNKSGGSPELILEKIPEKLRHYWWRGFCDGDGSFTYSKNTCFRVILASCFSQDWKFAHDLCDKLGMWGYERKREFIHKKSGNINRCSNFSLMRKEDISSFGNYIYQNVENDNIGFPRKYNKFKEMVDIFNLPQNKGKTMVRKKVQVLDKDGNKLNEFPSLRQAAIHYNVNYRYLKPAMWKVKSKTVGDITFTQIDDDSRSTNPTQ
jgi:hypothetical protein